MKIPESYILVQMFRDQLTGGAKNIMNLQCLASKIGGVAVIEPMLISSYYGVDMNMKLKEDTIWFRDIHDIAKWNNYTTSQHYTPLVSFEYFNETVHKYKLLDLIIVEWNCENRSIQAKKDGLAFCEMFGLKLVKHVCFKFTKTVEILKFKEQLL